MHLKYIRLFENFETFKEISLEEYFSADSASIKNEANEIVNVVRNINNPLYYIYRFRKNLPAVSFQMIDNLHQDKIYHFDIKKDDLKYYLRLELNKPLLKKYFSFSTLEDVKDVIKFIQSNY